MSEQMNVSLDLAEVDVVLSAKDGEEKHWKLVELLASERNKYLNKMTGRMVIKDGKAVRIKSFDGFQADLLCVSLVDETDEPVAKDVIEALPAKTQHALFERARDLSGLNNQQETDASKND